jgi:hypothetical protein
MIVYICKGCGSKITLDQDGSLNRTCDCKCGATMDMGQVKMKQFSTMKERPNLNAIASQFVDYIVHRLKELRGEA